MLHASTSTGKDQSVHSCSDAVSHHIAHNLTVVSLSFGWHSTACVLCTLLAMPGAQNLSFATALGSATLGSRDLTNGSCEYLFIIHSLLLSF